MTANFEMSAFSAKWNVLDRGQKMHLRRLVRMGRKIEDPELADLAPDYAKWQMSRMWMRYFWFWFIPGIFVVLGVAANIHPILLGVVIALGAQAVWAQISLRKFARRAT